MSEVIRALERLSAIGDAVPLAVDAVLVPLLLAGVIVSFVRAAGELADEPVRLARPDLRVVLLAAVLLLRFASYVR